MNREALERPFEENLIKTRRGAGNKLISYVEGTDYIRRLNEAFECHWSFKVREYQILEHDVVVLGELTAGDVVKTAFGGSSITRDRQSGEAKNLADDLKGAATDALKKASSLLGLGLHLYSEAPASQNGQSKSRQTQNRPRRDQRQRRSRRSSPPPADETVAMRTDEQLKVIGNLARLLGWGKDVLYQHSRDTYHNKPEHLSKADADAVWRL